MIVCLCSESRKTIPRNRKSALAGNLEPRIAFPSYLVASGDIVALETSYRDAMKAKDGKRTAALSASQALGTAAQGVMSSAKDTIG